MTLWAVAHQAPLSMEFSRQKYWSGLPCPPPGDLPDPGIEPTPPALKAVSLTPESPGKPTRGHSSHLSGQEKLGPGEDSSLDIAPWQAQARWLIAVPGIPMQGQGGCWKLGSSGQAASVSSHGEGKQGCQRWVRRFPESSSRWY